MALVLRCTDRLRKTSPTYSSATGKEMAALVELVWKGGGGEQINRETEFAVELYRLLSKLAFQATSFQFKGRTTGRASQAAAQSTKL
jgi:hypothetical protein